MEILSLNQLEDGRCRRLLLGAVLEGALVAFPTDTLYGIGGTALDPRLKTKLDEFKGGRNQSPYALLTCSLEKMLEMTLAMPPDREKILARLLPGPWTFVCRASAAAPPPAVGPDGRIGIRVPAIAWLAIMMAAGLPPLLASSLNRSGGPACQDPRQAAVEFPEIDFLLDGGPLPPSRGSTVVDISAAEVKLLRAGDAVFDPALFPGNTGRC